MTHGEFAARLSADEQALYLGRRLIHLNVGPLEHELPLCGAGIYSPTALYTTKVAAVTCPACKYHLAQAQESIKRTMTQLHAIVPTLIPLPKD